MGGGRACWSFIAGAHGMVCGGSCEDSPVGASLAIVPAIRTMCGTWLMSSIHCSVGMATCETHRGSECMLAAQRLRTCRSEWTEPSCAANAHPRRGSGGLCGGCREGWPRQRAARVPRIVLSAPACLLGCGGGVLPPHACRSLCRHHVLLARRPGRAQSVQGSTRSLLGYSYRLKTTLADVQPCQRLRIRSEESPAPAASTTSHWKYLIRYKVIEK